MAAPNLKPTPLWLQSCRDEWQGASLREDPTWGKFWGEAGPFLLPCHAVPKEVWLGRAGGRGPQRRLSQLLKSRWLRSALVAPLLSPRPGRWGVFGLENEHKRTNRKASKMLMRRPRGWRRRSPGPQSRRCASLLLPGAGEREQRGAGPHAARLMAALMARRRGPRAQRAPGLRGCALRGPASPPPGREVRVSVPRAEVGALSPLIALLRRPAPDS